MTASEYVVLVDKENQEQGKMEKMAAHQQGLLHRAFSIFVFNTEEPPKLLLQQRALSKYHSGGLWTNTCCSHPRPNEPLLAAGKRRLQEELGFTCELLELGYFHYTAHFPNGLCENEIDHVLIGTVTAENEIKPNPSEVMAIEWATLADIEKRVASDKEQFTPWLAQAIMHLKCRL